MTGSFMARFGAKLVDNGYPVIPIQPGTKKPGRFRNRCWGDYPAWSRHCERATTEAEIEIWSTWPDAGVGIPCGSVIGIDIDVPDPEAALAIDRLARERLADTPAIRIGRAPRRLLVYRAAESFKGIRASPVEVLGLGQQFVAYALHPATGRPYEWPEESLAELALARLPAITESAAQAFCEEALALVPESLRPARLASGSRSRRRDGVRTHADLLGTRQAIEPALAFIPNADLPYDEWVRVGMALKGALGEEVADLFCAWSAQSAKDVPETTQKAWASFKPTMIGAGTIYHLATKAGWRPDSSIVFNPAVAREKGHPAAGLIAKLEAPAGLWPSSPPARPPPPPPVCFRLDGALKLFVDYILSTAIRPQPWLAVGAACAAIGVLMGRRYRTPTNLRSNLYVVGMAASGGGKDHARNCIKQAFLSAGLARYLGGNRIASGAGLLSALHRQPASLFQIDEFGKALEQMLDKRRAPKHLAEIWDLLTELATSAGSAYLGAEYADQKERPRQDIIEPCCCVHATTVPEPMWAALRHASLHDGSLARFLVFRSEHDIPDRNPNPLPIADVPAALLAKLKSLARGVAQPGIANFAGIDAPNIQPCPFTVPLAAEAEALFRALDEEITRRQRNVLGTGRDAVFARVWENTAKLALVKSASADPAAPMVRLEDAEWARAVVAHCVETMFDQVDRHVADNETERNHKRVLELIREAGPRGISKKHLYDRTRFLARREREDILLTLVDSERVRQEVQLTSGKPAIVYRAAP